MLNELRILIDNNLSNVFGKGHYITGIHNNHIVIKINNNVCIFDTYHYKLILTNNNIYLPIKMLDKNINIFQLAYLIVEEIKMFVI